jgi:dinuclear metal center YbgI/SA1388 family protein
MQEGKSPKLQAKYTDMQVKEVAGCLEAVAPPAYQEHYDNAGLLTGSPEWEVTGVLLTLDATEAVIEEAIRKGCNMVVAHHPLIFRGLKRLTGNSYVERAVILAVKNDIAVYAAHTNLDNVAAGVNDMICEKLGLKNRRILSPSTSTLKKLYTFVPHAYAEQVRSALFAAGAGHIGDYGESSYNVTGTGTFLPGKGTHPFTGAPGTRHEEPETRIEVIFPRPLEAKLVKALVAAHPYEEVAYDIVSLDNANQTVGSGMIAETAGPVDERAFLELVKSRMHAGCIRYTALRGTPVRKVAVCGGAGSFLLTEAIRRGADVFVSADFKYHEFFDADNQIVIADIGHFESEQFTVDIFYRILRQKFRNFAPLKSDIRTNPINYLP